MTDQNTLADKVRKIVNDMRSHADHDAVRGREEEYVRHFADLLDALLPSPPRPTLADMTREERRACRRMQCDVEGRDGRWVIVAPYSGDGDAVVISDDGDMGWISTDLVTPRPDLPRLEWPDTEKAAAPALPEGWRLADHKDHGRVVVTGANRRGYAYFVAPSPIGNDWHSCAPDELTYIDGPTTKEADQ